MKISLLGKANKRKIIKIDEDIINVVDGKNVNLIQMNFLKNEDDLKNSLEQFKLTFDLGPIVINTTQILLIHPLGFSLSCLYCTDQKYFLRYNFFIRTEEPSRVDYGKNEDLISRNFHEVIWTLCQSG